MNAYYFKENGDILQDFTGNLFWRGLDKIRNQVVKGPAS